MAPSVLYVKWIQEKRTEDVLYEIIEPTNSKIRSSYALGVHRDTACSYPFYPRKIIIISADKEQMANT